MKNSMKVFAAFLAALTLLSGCGSSSKDTSEVYSAGASSSNNYKYEIAYDSAMAESEEYYYSDDSYEYYDAPQYNEGGSLAMHSDYEKKIIKTANVSLEAESAEECYEKILAFVTESGGYEFSSNVNKGSGLTRITASVRINPDNLNSLLSYIGECGSVTSQNVTSDDITESYYDAKIRLENKKKNLEKYYEFLEMAENIEEVIMLQNQIDSITADIEAYEGRLKMWDNLVSETSVDISIRQKASPVDDTEDVEWDSLSFADMGKLIKNGFMSVINVLVAILQWLVIFLVSLSPVLLIAGIIVLIIVLSVKSKKKKKVSPETQAPADTTENNEENK